MFHVRSRCHVCTWTWVLHIRMDVHLEVEVLSDTCKNRAVLAGLADVDANTNAVPTLIKAHSY